MHSRFTYFFVYHLFNIAEELHRLWELLLSKLAEKGMKLQQALVLVQFLRQCDEVMFWINDKVSVPLPTILCKSIKSWG